MRRKRTSARALLGLAILSLAAAAGIALAASGPAAPTITSHPAPLTNSTSASFTYTDPEAGVSYKCNLDGASSTACSAGGITYPGPLAEGAHTFKVTAVVKGKDSPAASYSWTVDTTAPTTSLAFPGNAGMYSSSAWSAGCPTNAGLCGSANDANGVSAVVVSIRQGNGNWWGGSSFNKATETFNPATLAASGSQKTAWSYPLALPADGSYTIHVRATDAAGNATSAGSQLSSTFTVLTVPPPAPTIVASPPESTTSTSATFEFTDGNPNVTFLCTFDGSESSPCTSPKTYTKLATQTHTFTVKARDAAGNVSTAASYSWSVVKGNEESHAPFTISGNLSAPLAPGVARSLPLTITNPNNQPILVTSLVVGVQAGSTKAGCDGPTNLQLTQSNVSSTNTLSVPAKGQATIPAGSISAPQVLMKDLSSNQDACKGASFTFNYTGSAHS